MLQLIETKQTTEREQRIQSKLECMQEYINEGGTFAQLIPIVDSSPLGPLTGPEKRLILSALKFPPVQMIKRK